MSRLIMISVLTTLLMLAGPTSATLLGLLVEDGESGEARPTTLDGGGNWQLTGRLDTLAFTECLLAIKQDNRGDSCDQVVCDLDDPECEDALSLLIEMLRPSSNSAAGSSGGCAVQNGDLCLTQPDEGRIYQNSAWELSDSEMTGSPGDSAKDDAVGAGTNCAAAGAGGAMAGGPPGAAAAAGACAIGAGIWMGWKALADPTTTRVNGLDITQPVGTTLDGKSQ